MGESAGAQSVMFHLLLNESKELFHQAIMESNPAAFQYPTCQQASKTSQVLIDDLNCGSDDNAMECMRYGSFKYA